MIAWIAISFIQAAFINEEPEDKAALGKMLFFDPILSIDNTISCATCHKAEFAFADTAAVSLGVNKKKGARNTPSAMNVALQSVFFWDGRAKNLEEQALMPIENPDEMNLKIDEAISRLQQNDEYKKYFQKIFNSAPTKENLAASIAAFERTLETSNSPFDTWKFYDDSTAVDDAVKRGFTVFNTKGKCIQCHFGSNLTTNEFRNIGLFNGKDLNDSGRAAISHNMEDVGKFKVAALRNVAVTAPYMHNGMFRTLKEVIEFYDDPRKIVSGAIGIDSLLAKPLGLTQQDKDDLEAFLNALTDKKFLNGR